MTTKLTQKRFLEGTREFEIADDAIHVHVKRPLREERLTIGLSMLDPDPVVDRSCLVFYSRNNSEPLLSLFLDKPDAGQFNAFVETLKQRVLEEGMAVSGTSAVPPPPELGTNVYDEPPEFAEFGHGRSKNEGKVVNAARVGETIQLLEKYLASEEIRPLLSALEALKAEPQNTACFEQMEKAFNDLGITQGAVLTYAPYISILLADDPFGD